MEYKQIKDEHPKTWEAYMKFMEQHVKDVTKAVMDDMFCYGASMQYKSNTRHLYDFFDSYELYVMLTPNYGTEEKLLSCIVAFWEEIKGKQYMYSLFQTEGYKTRTEAEEAAFVAAFEILEQQLNK